MDCNGGRERTDRHSQTSKGTIDIQPGDTLVLLGDVKRGIAIPPKAMFSQFAAAVFETEQEDE